MHVTSMLHIPRHPETSSEGDIGLDEHAQMAMGGNEFTSEVKENCPPHWIPKFQGRICGRAGGGGEHNLPKDTHFNQWCWGHCVE